MNKEKTLVVITLIVVTALLIGINVQDNTKEDLIDSIVYDESIRESMKEWEMYCGSIGAEGCLEDARWIIERIK